MIAVLVLFGSVLSGAIHEIGHAIVGKMAGLDVVYVRLLPPGLRLSGEATRPLECGNRHFGQCYSPCWWAWRGSGRHSARNQVAMYQVRSLALRADDGTSSRMVLLTYGRYLWCENTGCDIQKFMQHTKWPPPVISLIGLVQVVLYGQF